MKYYKNVFDGHIFAVSQNVGETEIDKALYDKIIRLIANRPVPPAGYDYMLRADTLEWEIVELPPMPEPEPTAEDKAEAFDILMGVSE